MKHTLILLLLFISSTVLAVDYVTVTNNCPVITFSSVSLKRVSVYKNNIKVQKTDTKVMVTITSTDLGVQSFSWTVQQANAYGGKTLSTLYDYILTLIAEPC